MATERKPTQRDMALINILERVAEQLTQQDHRLDDIAKRQLELSSQERQLEDIIRRQLEQSSAMDRNAQRQLEMLSVMERITQRQLEQTSAMDRIAQRQNVLQQNTGPLIEKLSQDFQRYRSDMLGIVNEQDRITGEMREMTKRQGTIANSQDIIDRNLTNLSERSKAHEKAVGEQYEYSVKQSEALSKLTMDARHNNEKLHMDTEKRLGENHKEILQRTEALRLDTMRRLLALDGIESALQLLIVRTEPPEKKPFWVKRVFRKVVMVFKRMATGITRRFKNSDK